MVKIFLLHAELLNCSTLVTAKNVQFQCGYLDFLQTNRYIIIFILTQRAFEFIQWCYNACTHTHTHRKKSVEFETWNHKRLFCFRVVSNGHAYTRWPWKTRIRYDERRGGVSRITIINNFVFSRRSWFVQYQTFMFIIFSYKTPSKIIGTRETHDFYNAYSQQYDRKQYKFLRS